MMINGFIAIKALTITTNMHIADVRRRFMIFIAIRFHLCRIVSSAEPNRTESSWKINKTTVKRSLFLSFPFSPLLFSFFGRMERRNKKSSSIPIQSTPLAASLSVSFAVIIFLLLLLFLFVSISQANSALAHNSVDYLDYITLTQTHKSVKPPCDISIHPSIHSMVPSPLLAGSFIRFCDLIFFLRTAFGVLCCGVIA